MSESSGKHEADHTRHERSQSTVVGLMRMIPQIMALCSKVAINTSAATVNRVPINFETQRKSSKMNDASGAKETMNWVLG